MPQEFLLTAEKVADNEIKSKATEMESFQMPSNDDTTIDENILRNQGFLLATSLSGDSMEENLSETLDNSLNWHIDTKTVSYRRLDQLASISTDSSVFSMESISMNRNSNKEYHAYDDDYRKLVEEQNRFIEDLEKMLDHKDKGFTSKAKPLLLLPVLPSFQLQNSALPVVNYNGPVIPVTFKFSEMEKSEK